MTPLLAALVALQQLDSAADQARRRIADLPAAEQALEARITTATAAVDAVKTRLADNQQKRRTLDKDVAGVDTRLARFDDHRAAVKTNEQYTALLHEIATAKAEKDAIEERILLLMEEADGLSAELEAAQTALAGIRREAEAERAAFVTERRALETELARLAGARSGEVRDVSPALLAKYEQLLKGRRGIAVAQMIGDSCTACHVRLRPHVTQQVRRNDSVVQCESCQRILYWIGAPAQSGADEDAMKRGAS
jgi:predicted  nucleic acid-binding Zn-ribbon protein